jgi:Holliday junction resolvasome RuvABC endonuclease subunit
MESIHQTTVLGIDPGTRFMGVAVVRGDQLLQFAVRTLRNGERPYDVLGQVRKHVFAAIRDFRPNVVAIEKPLLLATKRAALVSVIEQELRSRTTELGIRVIEIEPREIRRHLAGNPAASKTDLAEAVVHAGFNELKPLQPMRAHRAALGPSDRERYWLHAFDALGVAVAAQTLDI